MGLSLDHITAVDCTPTLLVDAANDAGCDGICLFMEPMAVLPLMPHFDLYGDARMRRDLKARLDGQGLTLDVTYPFTLSARTQPDEFAPALACAAELGAKLVNALCYDRDPQRRLETFGRFCDLAASFGLPVGVEFYPPSQIRTLSEAIALVREIDRVGWVGVNVDMLHLYRSGGTCRDVAAAPAEFLLYGQFCDGPAECQEGSLDIEASSERRLAGEGVFDLAGFAAALPAGCPTSVEIPRNAALLAGEPRGDRVRRAVDGVRRVAGIF